MTRFFLLWSLLPILLFFLCQDSHLLSIFGMPYQFTAQVLFSLLSIPLQSAFARPLTLAFSHLVMMAAFGFGMFLRRRKE